MYRNSSVIKPGRNDDDYKEISCNKFYKIVAQMDFRYIK